MLSLIIIKRPKIQWKQGCARQMNHLVSHSKMFQFFVFQGEWNGSFYSVDWFTVIFQSFQKNLPVLQFEESHSEDICIHMRWSEVSVCRVPSCSGFWLSPPYIKKKKKPQRHTALQTDTFNRSLSMPAASISSLTLNSHPVHPLVR